MSPALLDIRGLRVAFGANEVVRGIDLQLQPGERLALVGESGSGKSVTALALLRLIEGAQLGGSVRWQGRELLACSEREMRQIRGDEIAMVFQEPMTALNPLLTIGQQIAEVLQLKRGLPAPDAAARVLALLREVGMGEPERRARSYPHQLSGGQRQRAMIAMALACEPKLLLADEPTTALDANLRLQMLSLLRALQERTGMAVLLITHDLALVRHFAQRVAVMCRGELVEQGDRDTLFARPQHPYTRELLGSRPDREGLAPAPDAITLPAAAAPAEPTAAEWEARIEAVRQAAYQDGYRDGLVALEGFKQSYAQQVTAQMVQLTRAYRGQLDELEQGLAGQVAEVAIALARQVVRSELALRPELVAQVAQEALAATLVAAQQIAVHLHPDDLPLVQTQAGEAMAERGARLVADASLTRGGCVVDSEVGVVDASVEARWQRATATMGRPSGYADGEEPAA